MSIIVRDSSIAMYVCNCKGVTEAQIREAIGEGLCTRREIARCLRVGTACGKCTPDLRLFLKREVPRGESTLTSLLNEHGAECFVLPADQHDSKTRGPALTPACEQPAASLPKAPAKDFRLTEPNSAMA
jgi:bacterioferritin-associated ferredoxin